MKENKKYRNQKQFWEQAGKNGYGKALFSSDLIGNYIMMKQWQVAIDIAKYFGLNENSRVLELGCGDGKFAENILSKHFKHIDALDISKSAIMRAKSISKSGKVSYFTEDITNYKYEENARWAGAFLMGFLHHVKISTPTIISRLSKVCSKIIVVEPNGNNIMRKLLELFPSYKQAGEDSFKLEELLSIFHSNGYKIKIIKRQTLMPSFMPKIFFLPVKKIENIFESNSLLSRLCSVNALGFAQDQP